MRPWAQAKKRKVKRMLELQHICYEVEDGKELLHDINLKFSDHVVAITGPNGGGKSTLARMIAGIIRPSSGRIFLDGQDITDYSITQRARAGVSYAFQQPVRFKGLRVRDLLNLAAGKDHQVEDACQLLSEVGLCARDYLDRELNSSLSGGEMKRIEIAMTLARGTALNIFDEPEAGIDLWSFQSLIQVFEKMRARQDGAILIISHQERILRIADKIAYIQDGRVAQYGPREEILPGLLSRAEGTCQVLTDKMEESKHV